MATLNKKTPNSLFTTERLAGGMGGFSAKQSDLMALKRCVLACLLWEDIAYSSGSNVVKEICALIPKVPAHECANLVLDAKEYQKLRHVPLLIISEMCKYDTHKIYVEELLESVITRADELGEFLSIYWRDGKKPIAAKVKKGLAKAFQKFDEYSLAKWNRNKDIKIRDVMRLVHPKPRDYNQSQLWKRLLNDNLKTPDTWEVGLSASKSEAEKRRVWMTLIDNNKLGALALLKNLRNMIDARVPSEYIRQALDTANPSRLLPIDFIRAADYAPDYISNIERLMLKCVNSWPKLKGTTIFVLDVSGSMNTSLSAKTQYTRIDAGISLAMLASSVCENIKIYLTAGGWGGHKTKKIAAVSGFGLKQAIRSEVAGLGGGGIFTRQCLEFIKSQEYETPDRIFVVSDSQDCDRVNKIPQPFGKKNYLVDISSHKNSIDYGNIWDASISGWSEYFLHYIAEYENLFDPQYV